MTKKNFDKKLKELESRGWRTIEWIPKQKYAKLEKNGIIMELK